MEVMCFRLSAGYSTLYRYLAESHGGGDRECSNRLVETIKSDHEEPGDQDPL